MSKMFVLFGIVMIHAAVAVRDSTWLSNSPHHSMEREQIAYEPSKREIQEFQEVLRSFKPPMSATKEQARVMIQRLRNTERPKSPKSMAKNTNLEGWTRWLGGHPCTEFAQMNAMPWWKEWRIKHLSSRKRRT